MRAELDKTSSALEEALEARERLRERRLQTARVGAGVAALQQRMDALDAAKLEVEHEEVHDIGEEHEESQKVPGEEKSSHTFEDDPNLPRMENLSESIAHALEPVRAFCDARTSEMEKIHGAKSAPAGVPELARAFEQR
jgi:phage host-nuclease inhibitor protein Gam